MNVANAFDRAFESRDEKMQTIMDNIAKSGIIISFIGAGLYPVQTSNSQLNVGCFFVHLLWQGFAAGFILIPGDCFPRF